MWERVYQSLERAILNKDILPGQKMNEDEIGTALVVSTKPVREALE